MENTKYVPKWINNDEICLKSIVPAKWIVFLIDDFFKKQQRIGAAYACVVVDMCSYDIIK